MSEHLTHLKELEAESIYILREVAAQFERPCILFSGGKDSIVLTYLAYKAFYPAKIPFPLVHIDTGHNFPETLTYRDDLVKKLGADLIVGYVTRSKGVTIHKADCLIYHRIPNKGARVVEVQWDKGDE